LDLIGALHLRQAVDLGLQVLGQGRHLDTCFFEQGLGAVFLADHGQQDVGWLDVRVVARHGQALGLGQRFLKLGGEFVESHELSWRPVHRGRLLNEMGHQKGISSTRCADDGRKT